MKMRNKLKYFVIGEYINYELSVWLDISMTHWQGVIIQNTYVGMLYERDT